jgi:hypothetical protein
MKRSEAVAIFKELSTELLIQPSWVLVEQRKPDRYQLCVKGEFDLPQLETILKKYALSFEEDTKGYLCIFKP